MKVTVIGPGRWGSCITWYLDKIGNDVTLYGMACDPAIKAFKETTDITGIVLTKLDGTAKGGVVLGIVAENQIPVKFVGVGEQIDDMEIFNSDEFLDAII